MTRKQFEEKLDKKLTRDPELMDEAVRYLKGKRRVYLCLPFEGDVEAYAAKVREILVVAASHGYAVMAPYMTLLDRVGGDSLDPEFTWECVLRLIEGCDEFWVARDVIAPNTVEELSLAAKLGKRIMYIAAFGEEDNHG